MLMVLIYLLLLQTILCAPPTTFPTVAPTRAPSRVPTVRPTTNPTMPPTTYAPTLMPSANPSARPTCNPSANPTVRPSAAPSTNPTAIPDFFLGYFTLAKYYSSASCSGTAQTLVYSLGICSNKTSSSGLASFKYMNATLTSGIITVLYYLWTGSETCSNGVASGYPKILSYSTSCAKSSSLSQLASYGTSLPTFSSGVIVTYVCLPSYLTVFFRLNCQYEFCFLIVYVFVLLS